jgi:hypothetical protein
MVEMRNVAEKLRQETLLHTRDAHAGVPVESSDR